jgi:hypothetical protein
MRIFITGCAKSGTTLLRRLFHAFDHVDVIDSEITLNAFLTIENSGGVLIGKRAYGDIFSDALSDGNLNRATSLLINNSHIKVVNIFRDGRDVIESGIKPARWIAAVRQMLNYLGCIAINVRYEDLVKSPDVIQNIIANHLYLDVKHKFSEYPSFFPGDQVDQQKKYRPRPIAADRIGKDLDLYKQRVVDEREQRTFENLGRSLGYAIKCCDDGQGRRRKPPAMP